MNRTLHIILSLLTILIILAAMFVIVLLIHYAVYGNPLVDVQHFINNVRSSLR